MEVNVKAQKDDWTNQHVRAQAGLRLVGLVLKFSGSSTKVTLCRKKSQHKCLLVSEDSGPDSDSPAAAKGGSES